MRNWPEAQFALIRSAFCRGVTCMWKSLYSLDARNCGNLHKLACILKLKVALTCTPTGKENWRHFFATQTDAFSSPSPFSLLLPGGALAQETTSSEDTGFWSPTIG